MSNQTLAFALVIVTVSLTITTLVMAFGRKERHLKLYSAGFVFLAACFLIYPTHALDGIIPSLLLSNAFFILFHFCMTWGIRTFYGQKPCWAVRFWVYLAFYLAGLVFLTYGMPSFRNRALFSSAFVILLVLEFLMTLIRNSYGTLNAIRIPVIVFFVLCVAFHALRGYFLLSGARFDDTASINNPITTLTLSFTLFITILWSGGILLLDNAKLVTDLVKKNIMLENLALKDELTGLFNRHSLDQTIVAEMQRQNRYQEPVSLIMLDLDHFKGVNDRFGHDAGDVVLVEAARRVLKGIRSTDYLFRWGGEEFLILMPNTNLEGAELVAEKLRCALLGAPMEPVGTVTASFGVAERMPGESREEWFRHVDQAMYRAKRAGRNRVEKWKPGNVMPVATVSVEWQKEWNSGVKSIDREHQELIRLGNEMLRQTLERKKHTEIKSTVESLVVALYDHCRREEEILRATGYPDLEHHSQVHQTLYAEAREMQESYNKGKTEAPILFDFIVHKLILDHILTVDVQYYPFLGNGKNGKADKNGKNGS